MAGESLRSSGRIFINSMRSTYEHLGMVLYISLVWFALAFLPGTFFISFARQAPCLLTFLLVFLVIVFLAAPMSVAVCSVAQALLNREDPGMGDLWRRFRAHYWLTVKASAAMLTLLIVLVVDIVFFLSSSRRIVQWIAVPWFYLLIYWLFMTLYIAPLIAREQVTLLELLKRAALLVLDNLVVTVASLLEVLLVFVLCWLLQFPVFVLQGGVLALLLVTALNEVLGKYEKKALEEPEEELEEV